MNVMVEESFDYLSVVKKKMNGSSTATYVRHPTFLTMQDIEKFHIIFPMYGSSLAI